MSTTTWRDSRETLQRGRAERIDDPKPRGADGARNQRAVTAALREGHREFLGFVRRHTASVADAEDVLQDFYLKVVRSAWTLRSREKLGAWLAQVLRRTLADHYRGCRHGEVSAVIALRSLADMSLLPLGGRFAWGGRWLLARRQT